MHLRIIQNRNTFFIMSGVLIVLSVISLSVWGLKLGIDFNGGSLLEIAVSGTSEKPAAIEVSSAITEQMPEIGEVRVQPTEEGYLVRMKDLDEVEHKDVVSIISEFISPAGPGSVTAEIVTNDAGESELVLDGDSLVVSDEGSVIVEEKRFESIGPVIGNELKQKAVWAVGIALLAIILFIAFAFRKVSKPVASWKYGIGAIIALAHDIIIVVGIFSVLNHFYLGYEVGILFVTALLTILGYSVNDTIVVFDRTRENLIYNPQKTFEETVNKSVNDTIGRSVNTGITTLLVLLALYFLGGATIQMFVLALILGTVVGTYSSIFIASPLLVVWQKISNRK